MKSNRATIIADLGFGDAGKGTTVDYLARKGGVAAVVRYNGGVQARHNVVTSDGRHHGFSQFGSGAFVPGMRTHLSRFMLIEPSNLAAEEKKLQRLGIRNTYNRLTIDEDALVTTWLHIAANRLREIARGENRHGTCGLGIGETVSTALAHSECAVRARDLSDLPGLREKFYALQELLREELRPAWDKHWNDKDVWKNCPLIFADKESIKVATHSLWSTARALRIVPGDYLAQLAKEGDLIFEGAQGVLLDEWRGFHPYTTWSTTTFANALTLLGEIGYQGEVEKLGVLRAYFTRHGAGPFVTEDPELTKRLWDRNNLSGGWQGEFRVGWFDAVAARYAIEVRGGVDSLALTNLDHFAMFKKSQICTAYEVDGVQCNRLVPNPVLTDLSHQEALTARVTKARPLYELAPVDSESYIKNIERTLNVPVSIASYGPTAADKVRR